MRRCKYRTIFAFFGCLALVGTISSPYIAGWVDDVTTHIPTPDAHVSYLLDRPPPQAPPDSQTTDVNEEPNQGQPQESASKLHETVNPQAAQPVVEPAGDGLPKVETSYPKLSDFQQPATGGQAKYAIGTVATMLDNSTSSEAFLIAICVQRLVLQQVMPQHHFDYVVVIDPLWRDTFPAAKKYFDYLEKEYGAVILELSPPAVNPWLNLTATEINMLLKVHLWSMTRYLRIIFLDGDIFPAGDISKGWTLYGNTTMAYFATRQSPLHGGVYTITPSLEAVRLQEDLLMRANFSEGRGWDNYGLIAPWPFLIRKECGREGSQRLKDGCQVASKQWTFAGAKTDQGIWYYLVAANKMSSTEIEVDPELVPFVPTAWKVYHCIGHHKPWTDRPLPEMMEIIASSPHFREGWYTFWRGYSILRGSHPELLSEALISQLDRLRIAFYNAHNQTCLFVPGCVQYLKPVLNYAKYPLTNEQEGFYGGRPMAVKMNPSFRVWLRRHLMHKQQNKTTVPELQKRLTKDRDWDFSNLLPLPATYHRTHLFQTKMRGLTCKEGALRAMSQIAVEGPDRLHWGKGIKSVELVHSKLSPGLRQMDVSPQELRQLQAGFAVKSSYYQVVDTAAVENTTDSLNHNHPNTPLRTGAKGKSILNVMGYNMYNYRNQWLWLIIDMMGIIRGARTLPGHIEPLLRNQSISMRTPFEGEGFVNSTSVIGILKMPGKVSTPATYNLATGRFDVWSYNHYRLNVISLHHDATWNPFAGTLFVLRVWKERVVKNDTKYDIKHDEILELNPDMQVVWRWGGNFLSWATWARAECDTNWALRANNGQQDELLWCTDYMHSNSLHWDPIEEALYIHVRNWDTFFKVSRRTGKVEWGVGRLGNLKLYDNTGSRVPNDIGLFNGAHGLIMTGRNKFLLNDNNISRRSHPSRIGRTRIVEIEVNEGTRTATVTWEWTAPQENCKSQYMGSVMPLPNGNILAHLAEPRQTFEISKSAPTDGTADRIQWHLDNFNSALNCTFCMRSESYKVTRFYASPVINKLMYEVKHNQLSFVAYPPQMQHFPQLGEVTITDQGKSGEKQTTRIYFSPNWEPTCVTIQLQFQPSAFILLNVSSISEPSAIPLNYNVTKSTEMQSTIATVQLLGRMTSG